MKCACCLGEQKARSDRSAGEVVRGLCIGGGTCAGS